MDEYILSAGIDIGTSTTQMIFSRLLIKNINGFGIIPKIEIISKEIIYRSAVYFTPLLSEDEIDGEAVKDIIQEEYKKANIKPEDLSTGAVIITGETSRKRNAKDVVHALSELAGDFVVATAGPDLESVLAGKDSGAQAHSLETDQLIANLDIGGGTTNICYFQNGMVVDTACLDIGGRLIKISSGKITYISAKMKQFLKRVEISLQVGDPVDVHNKECMDKLYNLVDYMVLMLEQSVSLISATENLDFMKTNRLISCKQVPDVITFSGGVADCIKHKIEDKFAYGDIGVLLGERLRNSVLFQNKHYENAKETMNATVIGAGNFSMEVSGSTIEYSNCNFPIKNVPIINVDMAEENLCELHIVINDAVKRYREEEETVQIALASKGLKCPSYVQIEKIAEEIVNAMESEFTKDQILILVLEYDIGKALGQAIKRLRPKDKALLCIDHISCHNGDYIDIGTPVAAGKVVPVVIKTLIFNT